MVQKSEEDHIQQQQQQQKDNNKLRDHTCTQYCTSYFKEIRPEH